MPEHMILAATGQARMATKSVLVLGAGKVRPMVADLALQNLSLVPQERFEFRQIRSNRFGVPDR